MIHPRPAFHYGGGRLCGYFDGDIIDTVLLCRNSVVEVKRSDLRCRQQAYIILVPDIPLYLEQRVVIWGVVIEISTFAHGIRALWRQTLPGKRLKVEMAYNRA